MILIRTPFRISLFGGGSDFPDWFRVNGGQVLSSTIDKYCYLTARIPFPVHSHKYRIIYSRTETTSAIDSIMHPVVRECIRNFASNFPLEIHHDADLPAQSGIGSSSAFTVALIHALHSLQGLDINCNELAAKAIQIEYRILKENVGWQDQISCAIGGLNYIKFGPDESWQVHPINQDTSYINMLFSRLALVYTGTQRYSSNISENLIEGIRNKNNQISKLMLLADQCRAIFETQGDLDQIGSMLDYSWQIKKSLNSNATNHEINELYKLGIKSGASGGKLIGAGGGGFLLFYLPKDDVQSFQEKMQNFTVIPINISNTGSTLIHLA